MVPALPPWVSHRRRARNHFELRRELLWRDGWRMRWAVQEAMSRAA